MPPAAKRTTIAILGGNTVVGGALSILLKSVGYETRILEEQHGEVVERLLDGVDVLLLAPGLSDEPRKAFVGVVRGNPKIAATPVLTLSGAFAEMLNDGSVLVPWPTRIEHLTREIEAALASARSSNGQEEGTLSVCGCGRRGCGAS